MTLKFLIKEFKIENAELTKLTVTLLTLYLIIAWVTSINDD